MFISDADLKELLAMNGPADIGFNQISIADKLNMPSILMAFKYKGDKGSKNVTKFGQSLDPNYWSFIPTEGMIWQPEEPDRPLFTNPIHFWRQGGSNKPYVVAKTEDGWAFIGKFDRPYAPPFNGEQLVIYDDARFVLWRVNHYDVTSIIPDEKRVTALANTSLQLLMGNFKKANICKNMKILRKGSPKPSGDGWERLTYDKIKEMVNYDYNLITKQKFLHADLWYIPADQPVNISAVGSSTIIFCFNQIGETMNLQFYLLDHLKLLVDKEEEDD